MKVVIVAKTRMGSGACVGGLTFDGRSLRLTAADRETNDHFNMEYQVGEVWEIETRQEPEIIPPHVENVIVERKSRSGTITKIHELIEKQMPPLAGGVDVLFDGLTNMTHSGALYICEETGIPQRSTLFWRPDQPLTRDDDQKRIRYRYPNGSGGCSLTFVGFQEPVPEIPAGALVRISLAHWWRPAEFPHRELRCYVQISGWFLEDDQLPAGTVIRPRPEKHTYQEEIPRVEGVLKQVFGYPHFLPLQREIIEKILSKENTLAVMPTGSGKSMCYQLPATLFPGLTVVVSPLISLMEDQVLELAAWGVPAVYLNSTLSHREYLDTVRRIKNCEVQLLYAAPETLLRPETIVLLESCLVDCLVIDEAHCISEWGHDFRPEYRQLINLRSRLPQAVTLALTATATKRVRQDIKDTLGIPAANEFVSSFNRANLFLSVIDKLDPLEQTRAFLDAHTGDAGIIYCATRDQVDTLAYQLAGMGYPVLPYHAGMEDSTRRGHQHRFRFEDGIIIVATIAFGMGINKSNVRFILHYDLPKNLESYYQQIGRSGRDGLRADCLMLYSYGDVATINFFIKQQDPKLQPGSRKRLDALLAFVDTLSCRRNPLLAYFGESYPDGNCGACDNCLQSGGAQSKEPAATDKPPAEAASEQVDLSVLARQFLTCVRQTGEIFGMMHIIDVLRGSKAKKVLNFSHHQLDLYGAGRAYSKSDWRNLASQFVRQGLLERTRPHQSLKVTAAGKDVLKGGSVRGTAPGIVRKVATSRTEMDYDRTLFEQLRALRARLAGERGIPPYVIFHDRALVEMSRTYPRSTDAFVGIYGVGQRKLKQYGPQFIQAIRAYCEQNPDVNIPNHAPSPARQLNPHRRQRMEHVWEQFQAGKSIPEIYHELDVTQSTIVRHLSDACAAGKPLRMDGLVELSILTPDGEKRVMQAFEELGTERLKPVFEALDQSIPYDQIHLWRLIYQVKGNG